MASMTFIRAARNGREWTQRTLHRLVMVGLTALAAGWPTAVYAQAGPEAVADTVVTDCSSDTQLRTAVNVAGPSTVTFACGAGDHTIPIIGAAMTVPGAVTVDGANHITLDGGDLTAIFQVFAAGNLTLRNLTVANGAFNGVHPLENFGHLTLDNVTVTSNQSTGTGGAIYNADTLVVRDSRFTDNEGLGTATNTNGAAIYNESGVVTVQDSTFTGNQTTSPLGSGGAIAGVNGTIAITNSVFRNNQALNGGALFLNAGAAVTVTNASFSHNMAGNGGAIESNGQLKVEYSTFITNEATGGGGGGIRVLNGTMDLSYSTISDNRANTTGGGISCYGNKVTVSNSTLDGNTAKTLGGGIYSICNLDVTNATLSGNTGQGGGGGIYQQSNGTATVTATTIAYNSGLFGAGVYNDGGGSSTLTLRSTILADNITGNCDGVIASSGYNLSSDTNCAALTQTGDQQNVSLPLGPLTGNGGPTATHYPLTGNPAIEAIPAAQCGVSIDQRGVARPQGTKCEIGAVELSLSLWLPFSRK